MAGSQLLLLAGHLLVLTGLTESFPLQSLYSVDDPGVIVGTKTNFSELISHKQNAFLVQFYNSWCGHCIRFAPVFKEFAKDISSWNHVVQVVVVDCADDVNTELCRECDISMYPSLKTFWINANPPSKREADSHGQMFEGEIRSIKMIRHGLIDYLVKSWSKGAPREWPDLMPQSASSKLEFTRILPFNKHKPILLIIESETSYVGREIILDLSGYQDSVIVLRVVDLSKALLTELLPKPVSSYSLPMLVEITHGQYNVEILKTASDVNSTDDVRYKFVEFIKNKYTKETNIPHPPKPLVQTSSSPTHRTHQNNQIKKPAAKVQSFALHSADLYNALRYSLYQQIPLHRQLNSTQLNVFKKFLTIVDLYFPFDNSNAHQFIKMLSKWASTKNHFLDIEELKEVMSSFEPDYSIPPARTWISCQGSEPKYRGYPCSLWLMFHVLTVKEYIYHKTSPRWSNLHDVLFTMRDYISNFFSCTHCAKHFTLMAADLENELKYPNSSVIWLWKAHNKVNDRLAGDITEDPQFPKSHFPSLEMCPSCTNENSTFNFLINIYKPENIIKDPLEEPPLIAAADSKSKLSLDVDYESSGKGVYMSWTINIFSGMDYSICFFLYFISASIIVSLCLIIKVRGNHRRKRYSKLGIPYQSLP